MLLAYKLKSLCYLLYSKCKCPFGNPLLLLCVGEEAQRLGKALREQYMKVSRDSRAILEKTIFLNLSNLRHAFMKWGKRIYIKCSNMIQKYFDSHD